MASPPRLSSAFYPQLPLQLAKSMRPSKFRRTRSKEPKADPANRQLAVGFLLLAGVVLVAGLWLSRRSTSSVRERAPLDVLLITIDTLRPDALGAYGNSRAF